jgi:hypothetical protein
MKRAGGLGPILAGLERAKQSKRWREGFVPNPSTWLNQDRWLDETGIATTSATPSTIAWNGPEAIREAFGEMGDDWCRSYLDPCAWQDVPERALIPATAYAGRKIVADAKHILRRLGLEVLERAA